jgi:hypothetical protein
MKRKSKRKQILMLNNIYFHKMKKIILFIVFIILFGCKTTDKNENFTIDLTAVYKNNINSYKIEPNGKVMVLFNKTYNKGKLYETEFTKQEMDSIQVKLFEITNIKCDTLIRNVSDGLRYAITLYNQKQKFKLSGNLCAKYEALDKLVYSIVEKVDKKEKKEFYDTFNRMVPPTTYGTEAE